MQDWLSARAEATPNQIALMMGDIRWTYAQLNAYAGEYASVFHLLELKRGQLVALLLSASADYVSLIHAAARPGIGVLPLNMRLTLPEIENQLQQTGCTLILHNEHPAAGYLEQQGYTTISLPDTRLLPTSKIRAQFESGHIFLDDPAAVVFTSGTSGTPRGAVLTYANFFYSAMASAYHLGTQPDDRWLCVLPLYHVGGLSIVYRACLYGITLDLHEKFDVERVNHALTHEPVTLVSLVPTMLYRLLEVKKGSWNPKLRAVLVGGAAASLDLLERCQEENIPVAITYGLTEAASQVATSSISPPLADPLRDVDALKLPLMMQGVEIEIAEQPKMPPGVMSVGRPLLFTGVRIADESGQSLPPHTPGEIVVRGPTVMQGYHNDPEATARVLRGGELYTGDIGYLDESGQLFVLQRRDDLIISGGENIYPAEIEGVLKQHPAVKEVCVVGIDDAEWGQKPAAAIVLKSDVQAGLDDILAFSRERLAGYKQPRLIKVVNELPQTASGKIHRAAVKALFVEGAA